MENCLNHRDIGEIEDDVREFYTRHPEMELAISMEVMIRGAMVAMNDTVLSDSSNVEGITRAEENALRNESDAAEKVYSWRFQAVLAGFRDFTWGLKVVLLTTGTAAMVQ